MSDLINFDIQLFHTINSLNFAPLVEQGLIYARNSIIWVPLYAYLIFFIVYNFASKWYYTLLVAILNVATADIISSQLIKKTVQRIRPCNDEMLPFDVIERIRCGSGYSFTSSHAANHFAVAMFFFLLMRPFYPKGSYILFVWAATICFAQVYVGVHYPLDVCSGAILGASIGYLWFKILNHYFKIATPQNVV